MVMKPQFAKNETLDRLGAGLLKAAALRDDEIDAIADGRDLFSAVRARVIADRLTGVSPIGSFTFFQRAAIVSTAAAVIVVAVFATLIATRRVDHKTIGSRVPVVDKKAIQPANLPDEPTYSYDIPKREPDYGPRYEKAIDYRPVQPRRMPPVRTQPQYQEPPQEFYALADMRPSDITNGRVIRVDLPRASLVALGVNIPLDSDKQMIKTDLLVGPDGVPRAIRLVE